LAGQGVTLVDILRGKAEGASSPYGTIQDFDGAAATPALAAAGLGDIHASAYCGIDEQRACRHYDRVPVIKSDFVFSHKLSAWEPACHT
jgi:hypothetical protein